MELSKLTVWQGIVFTLLWAAYGSSYLLRKPLGVIKHDLQISMNISNAHLGWLDTALLLPYAGVSLALGSIGDRLGPRRTLGMGLLVAAAATVPMGSCYSLLPFLVLLAISGAGQALCWPAACTLLARWVSDKARNSAFGVFGTCCFVGGVGGTALSVTLLAQEGWRGVFITPAIIVGTLAILVLFLAFEPHERGLMIPGRVFESQQTKKVEPTQPAQVLSMIQVFRLPQVKEVSLAMFCVKAVRYALLFWLPLYLLRSLDYAQTQAGLASTSFEIGGVVGSGLVGFIVDRIFQGRALLGCSVCIFGSGLALIIFTATSFLGPPAHVLMLGLAGALNCGPDVVLAGSVAAGIGERAGGAASAVTGFINGMGSLGTVLEGPLVAFASAHFGWGVLVPLMVGFSLIGAAASLRAHRLTRSPAEEQLPLVQPP
ncbi:unnamed protein product [Meganyctiphanes norvegica]|uniref:Major facilitator superfamily (MFS) profile domain-containing protein n=1 Tax=Meganyctiphanes norvegica TaxID=48144 RepID=A0AAV2S8M5_MEGNR